MFAVETPDLLLFINNWAELENAKHQLNSEMDFND